MATAYLIPKALGYHTENTPVGASTIWDCVNDPPGNPDDNVTYCYAPARNYDYFSNNTFKTTSLPNDIISIQSLGLFIRFGVNQNFQAYVIIRKIDTMQFWNQPYIFACPSNSYNNFVYTLYVNPFTTLPWVLNDFAALEIGFSSAFASTVGATLVTQFYGILNYTNTGIIQKLNRAPLLI